MPDGAGGKAVAHDGCIEGEGASPEVRIVWSGWEGGNAVLHAVEPEASLDLVNDFPVTVDLELVLYIDGGVTRTHAKPLGTLSLEAGATQGVTVPLDVPGSSLTELPFSGMARVAVHITGTLDGEPLDRWPTSDAIFFHPGSDGDLLLYGEAKLLAEFAAGDFRATYSAEDLAAATESDSGPVLLTRIVGWVPDSEPGVDEASQEEKAP